MNKIKQLLFISLSVLFFTGCLQDDCTEIITYQNYTPIVMAPEEYRVEPKMEAPREFEKPGKIYYYQDYILLNEFRKGIHLINNINPENPVQESFIAIPGNVDMAIKNGILFADSYNDMISLSLGNMDHVQFLHRVEDVYPTFGQDHNGLEILGYDVETITEEVTCDSDRLGGGWAMDDVWFGGSLENSFDANSSSGGSTGLGGSLARFSIAGDHLYA
ncbi:MAG: hypothetical protein HKN16_05585, partial [Saprospiraceae bacterium]|nr:hypothetical protein [Saprospiraceae bacterium]